MMNECLTSFVVKLLHFLGFWITITRFYILMKEILSLILMLSIKPKVERSEEMLPAGQNFSLKHKSIILVNYLPPPQKPNYTWVTKPRRKKWAKTIPTRFIWLSARRVYYVRTSWENNFEIYVSKHWWVNISLMSSKKSVDIVFSFFVIIKRFD